MSENGEHRDSERADTGPKWVWWSTEESVARGTISVLACAEVAAGIWLYWWLIPWWLETNLHLLISILVAPLLLLRSPASVEAALTAFERYWSRGEGFFPLRSYRGLLVMFLAVFLITLAYLGLAETWLSEYERWSLFWRAGFIGWISLQIAFAMVGAGVDALVGAGAIAAAENVIEDVAEDVAEAVLKTIGPVLGLALVVVVVIAVSETVGEAEAKAVAIAIVAVVVVVVAGWLAGLAAVAVAVGIAVVLRGPGTLLGYWLRSVIIKFSSTFRHLGMGWGRLAVNWRSLVWAHDLRRPPELLPGIDRHPKLSRLGIRSLPSLYKGASGAERDFLAIIGALSLPFFFLPAWLYRLSLKSTCWFWWPLVFSQTSGRAAARAVAEGGIPGAVVVFEEYSQPWLAKFVAGLSLAFLVAAIGAPERLLPLLPVSRGGVDLLDALGDMIYLMLPCAGVQLALFLLCDRFLARAKKGHLGSWHRTAFRRLVSLRQFLLWSALFAALALYLENWVPVLTPLAEFVETHYFSWFPLLRWT